MRDISLPREASSVEESDNVQAVSRQSSPVQESENVKAVPEEVITVEGTEDIEELSEYTGTFEVPTGEVESVDRYLLQENVITTQPGSIHTQFPEYNEVDLNAPDTTPVLFKNIPFDKGSVDFYQRLQEHEGNVAKDKTSKSKDTILSKQKINEEHDYYKLMGDDQLHDIPSEDLDVYLPSSEGQSPKKRRLESNIPTVHKSQVQVEVLPSKLLPASKVVTPLKVVVPSKVVTPSEVVVHTERRGTSSSTRKAPLEKKFACRYCGKTFTNRTYTNYHEDRKCEKNMNLKLIVCECGKQYKNMSNYKDHRSKYHGDPSRHICRTCGASFPHQNSLVRHKATTNH